MALELLAASTMGPQTAFERIFFGVRCGGQLFAFFLFIHPNRTIFYSGVQYSPKDMRTFASRGTHIPVQSINPA